MANCKYCGAPAGFLRRSHRPCRKRYRIAEKQIPAFFPKALTSSVSVHNFAELTRQVAATHFVGDAELRRLALIGTERMVAQAMADGTISEADENRISEIEDAFGVEFHDLAHSTQTRVAKAKMLRELGQGVTPKVATIVGSIPINLQKNEIVLWIFNAVSYYVVRTETRYVGGSRGVSVRLMKGVSVRAGAHRGQKVQS